MGVDDSRLDADGSVRCCRGESANWTALASSNGWADPSSWGREVWTVLVLGRTTADRGVRNRSVIIWLWCFPIGRRCGPGHRERNTIRGNQTSRQPPSFGVGFTGLRPARTAAIGAGLYSVWPSCARPPRHRRLEVSHFLGMPRTPCGNTISLSGFPSRRQPATHRLSAASKHRCATD